MHSGISPPKSFAPCNAWFKTDFDHSRGPLYKIIYVHFFLVEGCIVGWDCSPIFYDEGGGMFTLRPPVSEPAGITGSAGNGSSAPKSASDLSSVDGGMGLFVDGL